MHTHLFVPPESSYTLFFINSEIQIPASYCQQTTAWPAMLVFNPVPQSRASRRPTQAQMAVVHVDRPKANIAVTLVCEPKTHPHKLPGYHTCRDGGAHLEPRNPLAQIGDPEIGAPIGELHA